MPPPLRPAREPIDLEDFLGGRVLAWLGATAVVAGLAFLLTLAVSRGWIGYTGRTTLAAALSLGLLVAGARLRERRVRNDASLAAAAAGVAGLFGSLVVAGPVYHLIPTPLALLGALATGAAATALAVRWKAQVMGWIGLLGALLAPAVLGHLQDAGDVAFLAVAYGATVAVLTWQRWTALAFTAFVLVTPQWVLSLDRAPSDPRIALMLAVFGILTTISAVGFEVRRREQSVKVAAIVLLVIDAVVLDGIGGSLFDPPGAVAGGGGRRARRRRVRGAPRPARVARAVADRARAGRDPRRHRVRVAHQRIAARPRLGCRRRRLRLAGAQREVRARTACSP